MDKQRLITDARRRAKALSRADGRPYQTHLDEVARLTGRRDWREFVDNPATLPIPTVAGPDTDAETTPQKGRPRRSSRRIAIAIAASVAVGLPLAATTALAFDASRMSDVSERVAAESAYLAHIHPPLVGFIKGGTRPASLGPMHAGHRTVKIIMNDMRVTGSSMFLRYVPGHEPYVFVGDDLGGRRMKEELANGALMRIVLDVDCARSTVRYLRFEAVTGMLSAPLFVHHIKLSHRSYPIISTEAQRDMCTAAPTPNIKIL